MSCATIQTNYDGKRLNDLKTQETYYQKIVDRFLKLCADTGSSAELDKRFASMSLSTESERQTLEGHTRQFANKTSEQTSSQPSPELAVIIMAMRKLREAIVATSRMDEFAQRAYLFIIRTTILFKHWESYHASLLYLLTRIHAQTPLSATELQEFVGYYILDLACRQEDYNAAFRAQSEYRFSDRKVDRIVKALVHDDWVSFWMVKSKVDVHVRALMSWAEERVRLHVLKCLARTYFTAEKAFVERSTNAEWALLVKDMQVGWELDGDKVTIRRPKAR